MTPRSAASDSENSLSMHGILTPQFANAFALCMTFANGANSVLREFGIGMAAAIQGVASSLLRPVAVIVSASAKEQVSGVDAGRVVATVKYIQSFGNWPDMQFVADTMRRSVLAINAYRAVTIILAMGLPFPAIIGAALVNILPKALDRRPTTLMADDEAIGFSLDQLASRARLRNQIGLSAAAAMAVTIGYFIEWQLGLGKLWGMLRHVVSASNAFGQAWDISRCRQALSIGSYSCIVSRKGCVYQW